MPWRYTGTRSLRQYVRSASAWRGRNDTRADECRGRRRPAIAVSPDGGTNAAAADSRVTVGAIATVTVADAPLQAVLVPIQAVEGLPFAGTVASFTDGNPGAAATEITASILWGDGSAASEGTIVADGNARFHVTGDHTYAEAGSLAIRVVVRDRGGSSVLATGPAAAPASILGLQAPRVAYAGSDTSHTPQSFTTGDFNGDGNADLAVWHLESFGSQFETLDVLLGNGDGSFRDP